MFRLTNFIIVFIILLTTNVLAEVVKDFKVQGNDRVSKQTIINFSKIEEDNVLSLKKIIKTIL